MQNVHRQGAVAFSPQLLLSPLIVQCLPQPAITAQAAEDSKMTMELRSML